MKKQSKILLTSVMTVAMSASLIAGATYALFTSESKTNIAITSGTVEVKATATISEAWSAEYVEGEYISNSDASYVTPIDSGYQFKNGGTAVEKDGVVSLNNVTPGDGVKVEVEIENNSNVAIQYRVYAWGDNDTGLYSGLKVTQSISSEWKSLTPGEAIPSVSIEVELPIDAGNEYAGKSCEFVIGVEAIQGNAKTEDFAMNGDTYIVLGAGGLDVIKGLVEVGESVNVQLGADLNLGADWEPIGDKNENVYFTGTFDGAGHTVTLDLSKSYGEGEHLTALFGAIEDATIKNLIVEGSVSGQNAAGIAGWVQGNSVIENCTNKATVTGTAKAGGIAAAVTTENGSVQAQFINCVNAGTVNGQYAGGIIGLTGNTATVAIIGCGNKADVTGTSYAGAAVGYALANGSGYVANFTNSGSVTPYKVSDSLHRYLLDKDGTLLCGYCGAGKWSLLELEEGETIAFAGQENIEDVLLDGETSYVIATEDIDMSDIGTLKIGDGKTLDLNGNSIGMVYAGGNHVYFSGTNATVKNGSIKTTGTNASTIALSRIENGAVVNFENVEFETNLITGTGINIYGGATVTFTECSFKNVQIVAANGEYDLTFNGCKFEADFIGNGNKFFTVSGANSGSLNLTDCTFNCKIETDINGSCLIATSNSESAFKVYVNNVTYKSTGTFASKLTTYSGHKNNVIGTFQEA